MILLFMTLLVTGVIGQWRDIRFDEIGQQDGYMARGVYDMAQDSLGHMYFATEMGLLRYDGTAFDYYLYDPGDTSGIAEGKVNCISIDPNGILWLGMNGVLDRFDPKSGTFLHNSVEFSIDSNSRKRLSISSILDDDDRLWLGGGDYTLHQFYKSTGRMETFIPENPDLSQFSDRNALGMQRIVRDRFDQNKLWLGVNELGLILFSIPDKRFSSVECLITMPWQDADGILWSGSYAQGLIRFDPANRSCTQQSITVVIPNVDVHATPPTHDVIHFGDQLWLGGPHGIIAFDNAGKQKSLYYDRENDNIFRFFQDQSGNIWIGPFGGSIKVFNPAAQHIQFFSINAFESTRRYYPSWQIFDPVQQRILAVHGWRDKIYSIEMDRSHADRNKTIETTFRIRGIVLDNENTIWVAGHSSLYVLDRTNDALKEVKSSALQDIDYPSINTWQLGADSIGNLTILGYYGFIYYHVAKDSAVLIPLEALWNETDKPEIFWSHSIDHKGDIWLTTESVIGRYRPGDGSFIKFSNLLPGRRPHWRATVADTSGNIWVIGNTLEQFVLQHDNLQHIRTLSSPGLPGIISGVHLHVDLSGRVWCFGQNGLYGVDPVSQEVRTFDLYDGLDNMYLDPLQSVNLPDGSILTHGGTGVMIYWPDSLWYSGNPPQADIVIKRIRVSGSVYPGKLDVNYITSVDLDPDDDFLDIHYRAIVLPRPRKVTYSYKVKGLSDAWIFHGNNETVTLTDLAPGNYTFYVKTGLPDSNSPVKHLDIFVATPYYLQVWFLLLCASAFLGCIYLFYQIRIRRIRREEALKTEFNKKITEVELQALRAQMNPHFMFNSLNSIKSYILKSGPLEAAEYLTNFSSLIRSILDNSREKQISLQKELDALLLYIDLESMRFPDKFNFIYKSSGQNSLNNIMIPPLILQPFVENAIWHGLLHKEEKGNLMLTIQKGEHSVECIIEDDGIGRKLAMELKKKSPRRFKSMGMGITQDRIALHNKLNDLGISVTIIDKEDNYANALGTRVVIHFPNNNENA